MHPQDLEIPALTPRHLTLRDELELTRSRGGFLRLFGFIWGAVGCGLMLLFAGLGFLMPPLLMGVAASSPFLIAGLVLLAIANGRIKQDRALLENGRLTSGEVVENVLDRALRKNRKFATRITCRCVDPESNRELTSKVRTWDDSVIADHPVGTELPMIIDAEGSRAVAPSVMGVGFGSGVPTDAEVAQWRRNRRRRHKQSLDGSR